MLSGDRAKDGRTRFAVAKSFATADHSWSSTDPQPQRIRDSSVTVGADWELLEEIDFIRLHKLNFNVEAPEDL
jgi:translation initiation factor 3 subunit D